MDRLKNCEVILLCIEKNVCIALIVGYLCGCKVILKGDGDGICICLSCYLGFCTGVRNHTHFHYEKTGHSLFLQIHRTELPTESNASCTLTRLAIEAEPPKKYETDMKVRCEACNSVFEAEGFVGQGSD